LREAGVSVDARRFDGQIHAFWQMPATFPAAGEAVAHAAEALRKAFA
jgi:acetyl esterase